MAMSPEAGPQGEPNGVDPVQEARGAFNKVLLGKEYHGGPLRARLGDLYTALLAGAQEGKITPERLYHEIAIVAGQGADRAELFDDTDNATELRGLQRQYELTYEVWSPRAQVVQATTPQPTRTETLPPMTSAKGGDRPLQTQKRPAQPTASTTSKTPAGPSNRGQTEISNQEPQDETFASFFRQKRTEAKLSQAKLGSQAGNISQTIISSIERGTLPDEAKVNQLISALGLNEEDKQKVLELYNKQKQSNSPQAPQQ